MKLTALIPTLLTLAAATSCSSTRYGDPKEVETVIDAIEGVAESAVVGVSHPDFGEAVVAIVLRRPGSSDVTDAGVIAVCKERLANYKVPKRVFFMDELPRNAMGKVQKNLLRDEHKDLFATTQPA